VALCLLAFTLMVHDGLDAYASCFSRADLVLWLLRMYMPARIAGQNACCAATLLCRRCRRPWWLMFMFMFMSMHVLLCDAMLADGIRPDRWSWLTVWRTSV
jgi:hypothetical protein